MKMGRILPALALATAIAVPALAAVDDFSIDPVHSLVGFRIHHLVSNTSGRFDKFSGTVSVDSADLSTAKISAVIDTASINTGNNDRDNHLRSGDFFDAAKFPQIKFESVRFIPDGPKSGRLLGNLTIRDVTKAVELKVDVLGFGDDPWGNVRGGFSARTTVNRKDFGMVWNKTLDNGGLLVGEEVEIQLDVEAVHPKPKPAKG